MAQPLTSSVPDAVKARYLEPHRKYHTLEHIYNGLSVIPDLAFHAGLSSGEMNLIYTAWWFHDAIYWPSAKDNEERSADLAEGAVPAKFAPLLREMIMSTVYPEPTRLVHPYIGIIQDADLYGLSQPEAIFDHHTAQVRAEFMGFAQFTEEEWIAGRVQFWEKLLREQRPIYKTEYAQEAWGHQANYNIQRELRNLGAG